MPDTGDSSQPLHISACSRRDGVDYAILELHGRQWRMGSITSVWQDKVTEAVLNNSIHTLPQSGIFLEPVISASAALAVMCCGLGSAWPGMGSELYKCFPAVRQVMDKFAALADWDILALLEQPDIDAISPTRWQIPYLFMLEYAQWQVFRDLGMQPDVICGHSLGELIALCLGGVYDLESAWYLLEIRAEHMAELEAKGGKQRGMLAIPAGEEEIIPILRQWPDLHISNRNTMRQFVLSGRRDELLQARKQLRRKRIPAIMLNMDLAFHNPAMRILRNMSLRRLNGLKMIAPHCTILSCVDAAPYPDQQDAICTRIADLDENTVDWVKLIEVIENNYPNAAFLELGPQETLCGLTAELVPGVLCIPADRRGHEVLAMRTACARLFANGFLDFAKISSQGNEPQLDFGSGEDCGYEDGVSTAPQPGSQSANTALSTQAELVLQLLAEASNRTEGSVTLDMDLRQDLALRSSQFPWLMLEAERRLGQPVVLENLFRLVTVGDLVYFLCGDTATEGTNEQSQKLPRQEWLASRQPLGRLVPAADGFAPAPLRPDSIVQFPRSCIFHLFPAEGSAAALLWFANIAAFPPDREGQRPRAIACLDNGYTDSVKLLDILNLELNYGNDDAVLWKPLPNEGGNAAQAFQRFAADSVLYCDVFPNPELVSGVPGDVLQLVRHFSLFRNQQLALHGLGAQFSPLGQYDPPEQLGTTVWLPLSGILETMAASAAIAVPWNIPIGFEDVRVFRLPAMPEGITRECVLTASARLSISLEGVAARLCHTDIAVAKLAETGRKVAGYLPVSEGTCILARESAPFPPVWQKVIPGFITADIDLSIFYKAVGLGPIWQFLADVTAASVTGIGAVNCWTARLHNPDHKAGLNVYFLVDACLQAAMFALAARHAANRTVAAIAAALARWRFAAIGFIRFISVKAQYTGAMRLYWAMSWEDEALTRFDAQICNDAGELLLTIHSLEFDRVE